MSQQDSEDNRVKLRCTNSECEMGAGFFTSPIFVDIYLNELTCILCGARHATELKVVDDE